MNNKKTVLLVVCTCGRSKVFGEWTQAFNSFKDFLDKIREGMHFPRACFINENTITVMIQFRECDECRKLPKKFGKS